MILWDFDFMILGFYVCFLFMFILHFSFFERLELRSISMYICIAIFIVDVH